MKRTPILRHSAVALAALVAASAATMHAQQPRPIQSLSVAEVRKEAGPARIDPARVQRVARPPIPFQPFETVNPQTGKAVNMDSTITLPNGRRMTMGQFYAEANRIERQLNQIGYSIRRSATETRGPTVISRSAVDRALLANQQAALVGAQVGAYRPISLEESQRRLQVISQLRNARKSDAVRLDSTINTLIEPSVQPQMASSGEAKVIAPLPVVNEWGKTFPFGDRSIMAVEFGFGAKAIGDTGGTSLSVGASADAVLAGVPFDVVDLTGEAMAPVRGNGRIALGFTVLGNTLWQLREEVPSKKWEGQFNLPALDFSTPTFGFNIGVVEVGVKLGARGNAGLSYGVALTSGGTTPGVAADVTPALDTRAYLVAVVDITIAEANAGGDLTLLKLELPISGHILLVQDLGASPPVWGVAREFRVSDKVEALKGSLYADVKYYTPCWALPPWCLETERHEFWNWSGFQHTGDFVYFKDFYSFLHEAQPGPVLAGRTLAVRVEGAPSVNTQSTLRFFAQDAATGAPVDGTVSVANQRVVTGQPVSAVFCRLAPLPVRALPSRPSRLGDPATAPVDQDTAVMTTRTLCLTAYVGASGYSTASVRLRPQ
jgi:hypothetical protein